MGYLPYYLISIAAAYALQYPALLAAGVAVFILRRFIPDPYLWLKHSAHVRRLRQQIAQNPDNATARRDLAKIWLDKRRPRRALPLLEEARRRDPDSVELDFLYGKALHMAGKSNDALAPLVRAAQIDERFQYGDAYLIAGAALHEVGRFAEAEDSFSRLIAINSSTVEGRVRLAAARREQKDKPGTAQALADALETYSHLPGYRRRKDLKWYWRAQLMRVGLA